MPTAEDAQPIPPNETGFAREARILQENGDGLMILKAALQMLLKTADANDAIPIVAIILREVFGPLNDDIWQRLSYQAELPCPDPTCSCHIHHAEFAVAIGTQRDLWSEAQKILRQIQQQTQQPPPDEQPFIRDEPL